jgi:hypothetical protein
VCLQRKRLDLTSKKLVYEQEVFLFPEGMTCCLKKDSLIELFTTPDEKMQRTQKLSKDSSLKNLLQAGASAPSPSIQRLTSPRRLSSNSLLKHEPKADIRGLLLLFDGICFSVAILLHASFIHTRELQMESVLVQSGFSMMIVITVLLTFWVNYRGLQCRLIGKSCLINRLRF